MTYDKMEELRQLREENERLAKELRILQAQYARVEAQAEEFCGIIERWESNERAEVERLRAALIEIADSEKDEQGAHCHWSGRIARAALERK